MPTTTLTIRGGRSGKRRNRACVSAPLAFVSRHRTDRSELRADSLSNRQTPERVGVCQDDRYCAYPAVGPRSGGRRRCPERLRPVFRCTNRRLRPVLGADQHAEFSAALQERQRRARPVDIFRHSEQTPSTINGFTVGAGEACGGLGRSIHCCSRRIHGEVATRAWEETHGSAPRFRYFYDEASPPLCCSRVLRCPPRRSAKTVTMRTLITAPRAQLLSFSTAGFWRHLSEDFRRELPSVRGLPREAPHFTTCHFLTLVQIWLVILTMSGGHGGTNSGFGDPFGGLISGAVAKSFGKYWRLPSMPLL